MRNESEDTKNLFSDLQSEIAAMTKELEAEKSKSTHSALAQIMLKMQANITSEVVAVTDNSYSAMLNALEAKRQLDAL